MSEEWNQDPRNSNWTDANTVRRLTETEVNSSTYQEQVRDRGVPQSYPDEWLELRWIRPGQTSLIPLQCRRREKRKSRGFTSIQMLHAHRHLHREAFYTEQLFHRGPFTRKSLYTQRLWHREVFTQRSFYTEKLLHRAAFTHRNVYTQRGFAHGSF